MFEDKYERSLWDEQYAYGHQEGYGIGYAESCLRYLIHCIRDKEETEEERKEKLWDFFETKCADDQYKEFCALVEKYPNLSKDALIRKVLMETEYCYF